jgi:hypothetical protein
MREPLADRVDHPIMGSMPRFRALAAVLACLAVFAGGLNVALAAHGIVSVEHSAVGTSCSDCNDCDKAPCPMPVADCIQMHANPGPALVAAPVELRAGPYVAVRWSPIDRMLSGLSPPPDPLPPRA